MSFKQRILSQNFIKDSHLLQNLISLAQITKDDIVIDIGAGKGIITYELGKFAKQVIAVEIDYQLSQNLIAKFENCENITIINSDILQYQLPSSPYKVFANIPFNITAEIIYKLLYYSNAPEEAYLIMQKEAAEKFSGSPNESQFSLLAKPWFEFSIIWNFKRSDFFPLPSVDIVLLKVNKRGSPLIAESEKGLYQNFIKYVFNKGRKNLNKDLKNIFTYNQWKRLSRDNKFNVKVKPTELKFEQWLSIFGFLNTNIGEDKIRSMKLK